MEEDDTQSEEEEEQQQAEVMVNRESILSGIVSGLVNDEVQEVMMGLSSRSQEQLASALGRMRKIIQSDSGEKLLLDYVAASPKCIELSNAWNAGPKAQTSVTLLFLLVEIFRHPIGLGPEPGGEDDAQKPGEGARKLAAQLGLDKLALWIVQNKLVDVYSHLSSGQRSRECGALRLMSAIVSRGKLLAKQVASKFDFSLEALKKLARHPSRKKAALQESGLKMTTRVAFIEFAVSFLVVGDAGLHRWILQKRALYAGVLHGLAGDGDETVAMVLELFKAKVLESEGGVPQGIQVALFGDAALEQLQKITSGERCTEVAGLAQSILLALCSDPRHGICPSGSSLEDFQRAGGQFGGGAGRLLRLMLKLRPAEAELHRELLLAISNARPLLGAAYIDSFPHSLEPRASTAWFSAVALLSSLVSIASRLNPFDSFLHEDPPPPLESPIVQSTLRRFWPQTFSRALFNRALLHEDRAVKLSCLRLLLEVLGGLERLLGFIGVAKTFSEQFQEDWSKLAAYFQDKARIVLPDCHTLLSVHSSLKKKQDESISGSKRKRKAADDHQPEKKSKKLKSSDGSSVVSEENVLDEELLLMPGETMESLLHGKLLDVLTAYQKVLPLALADVNFDPFKFVPQEMDELGVHQQKSLLALLLSAAELSTLRLTAAAPLYKSLKLVSRLVVSLKTVELRQQAYDLLHGALRSTGAFESNRHEAGVWLHCLPGWSNGSLDAFDDTVNTFLCDLISGVGKNLYKFVEQLHSVLQSSGAAAANELEFGPLVVCGLDTFKRLARPEAKSLKVSQKSAIAVYLTTVLRILVCSQVSPGCLAAVISSMLSGCVMEASEWTPLKLLEHYARTGSELNITPNSELQENTLQLVGAYPGAFHSVLSRSADDAGIGALVEKLPVEVLLMASFSSQANLLAHANLLENLLMRVASREVVLAARMILQEITRLHSSDSIQQLDACFTLLRGFIAAKEYSSELQEAVAMEVLGHPVITQLFLSDGTLVDDRKLLESGPETGFEELRRLLRSFIDELHPLNRQTLRLLEGLGETCVREHWGVLTQRAIELLSKQVERSLAEEREIILSAPLLLLSLLLQHSGVDSFVEFLRELALRVARRMDPEAGGLHGATSHQLLAFYFASEVFQKVDNSSSDVEAALVDISASVIHMAMLSSSSELADHCLLLVIRFLARRKLLVAVAPVEVLLWGMSKTNKVRAEVVSCMVEASPLMLAEFGRLISGSNEARDDEQMLGFLASDKAYRRRVGEEFCISGDDLMHLLPAAEVFLESFEASEGFSRDTLELFCGVYGEFLAKRLLEWEAKADFWAGDETCFDRCVLSRMAKVLELCAGVRPVSKKLKRRLLRLLLNSEDAGVEISDINKLAGKASVLKVLLLVQRDEDNSGLLELVAFLNSTLAAIYKRFQSVRGAEALEHRFLSLAEEALGVFSGENPGKLFSPVKKLAKTLLRFRYGKPAATTALQRVLAKLLQSLKDEEEDASRARKLATEVLEFVMAHSQFLLCLLVKREEDSSAPAARAHSDQSSVLSLLAHPGNRRTSHANVKPGDEHGEKLNIIKLLRVLLGFKLRFRDEAGGDAERTTWRELLSLLLAAYSATLSRLDLEILGLMHEIQTLEGGDSGAMAEMDYLWGDAALQRRKEKNDAALSSGNQLVRENLDEIRRRRFKEDLVLDARKCGMTALHFPVNRELEFVEIKDQTEFQETIYDPAFLLPFAMHAVSLEFIDAEEFVRLGLLAVAFSSMSAASEGLRKYSYELLATFTKKLEESPRFKGKSQIETLLVSMKNSITQPWERIPFVVSLFAAEASCVLMQPENINYANLNRFLLHSSSIDFETIPLFQTLLTSGNANSRSERAWMLRLLAGGLATASDALIYRRQFVAEILMSFCSSAMAESSALQWSLLILKKAAGIPSFASNLMSNTGVLSWLLSAAISSSSRETHEASLALEVLELLVSSKGAGKFFLAEGVEELIRVASTLLQFLENASSNTWKVFGKLSVRIIRPALRLSQKKNKYQSSFTLSWRWLQLIAQRSDEESRLEALECILQSPPPPVRQKEDAQALCSVIKIFSRDQSPASFIQWCSSAILLGTLPVATRASSFTSWWSYFTYLLGENELRHLDSVLIARLIVSASPSSEAGSVAVVNALLVLLSHHSKESWFSDELREAMKLVLLDLPRPVELDSSWRWSHSTHQLDDRHHGAYKFLHLLVQQLFFYPPAHRARILPKWNDCLTVHKRS